MTITGADYRLAGTSEDNHLGPFIRLRDLVVCFNSMQNLLSCVMWHRMSFNPGTVGPLCCAQNVLIFILYWFVLVKFRKASGRPGCFLVEMLWATFLNCCIKCIQFWTLQMFPVVTMDLRWWRQSFWLLGIFFPGIVAGHKTHRTKPLSPKCKTTAYLSLTRGLVRD